jgi:integrase/recombinase XerD
MKTLRQAVGDYLALRRSLGFKLKEHERCLRELLSFLKKNGSTRLTIRRALQFATQHQHQQPAQWAARLRVVRGFARYRSGEDPLTQIPPLGLLPYRAPRARPYLYSAAEIRKLLRAALHMRSQATLKPWTYNCLLGLLATTGMRISEALNLQIKDIDWFEGILTIHGTKFGKSRWVPLHPSTRKVLSAYAKRRDCLLEKKPVSHFFVSSRGTRLDGGDVRRTFYQLSRQVGLRDISASHGPRLHDFRHRFAVQTLLRWYRKGADVERLLPVLSTYLGHAHVTDTYWYLTNTPELMGAAGQRMEKRWGGLL